MVVMLLLDYVVLVRTASSFLLIFRIKLTQDSNLGQLRSFRKINIYVAVMEIATLVVLFSGIIWQATSQTPTSVYFMNFSALIFLGSCVILSCVAGTLVFSRRYSYNVAWRLFSITKDVSQETKLHRVLILVLIHIYKRT